MTEGTETDILDNRRRIKPSFAIVHVYEKFHEKYYCWFYAIVRFDFSDADGICAIYQDGGYSK